MNSVCVFIIFGLIGSAATDDLIKKNIDDTKMVMEVLKTFDTFYDEFQSTSYEAASAEINHDKTVQAIFKTGDQSTLSALTLDSLPDLTKRGYIRTMRSTLFFRKFTNDTKVSLTSLYTMLQMKFWALEYAYIFKLCYEYADKTNASSGNLAKDCFLMSDVMNVFALENVEQIINRVQSLEKLAFFPEFRISMFNVYKNLVSKMREFFDNHNETMADMNNNENFSRKSTILEPVRDLGIYAEITKANDNIEMQKQISLLKIFFQHLNSGCGYKTYLKIHVKIPELDELWPTWLMAESLFEKYAADYPEQQQPNFEYGLSNYQIMYRSVVADSIRTIKLDEFRSTLDVLLVNDGSGKAHTTDVSVRKQLIERYIVESMEFGHKKCYLNIEKTPISGFELYEYDSFPRYLSRERALELPKVKCGEGEKYISKAWTAAIVSYKKSRGSGLTEHDSIMSTLGDETVNKYFSATDDDDDDKSAK